MSNLSRLVDVSTASVVCFVFYCSVFVSSGAGSPLLVYCTGDCVCPHRVSFSRFVLSCVCDVLGSGIGNL